MKTLKPLALYTHTHTHTHTDSFRGFLACYNKYKIKTQKIYLFLKNGYNFFILTLHEGKYIKRKI